MYKPGLALFAVAVLIFGNLDAKEMPVIIEKPSGGEVYFPGQTQTVMLGRKTRAKSVLIELSRDGGLTFEALGTIDNTVKDRRARNRLTWSVAEPFSTNGMIRATSTDSRKPGSGVSGAFSIGAATSDSSGTGFRFVLKSGDAMSGALMLSGDPTTSLHAATKQYVDSKSGSASGVSSTSGNSIASALNDSSTTGTVNGGLISDASVNDSKLTNTGVTLGSYTRANITVNAQGRITAASDGAAIDTADLADGSATVVKVASFPKVRVQRSSPVSVANGNTTIMTFDVEQFDTDNCHDNVTNSSRLTCNTAGVYFVSGYAAFTANSQGFRHLYIRINGGSAIASDVRQAINSSDITVSTIYQLNVGDYIELYVNQNSSSTLNVGGRGFMMARLP